MWLDTIEAEQNRKSQLAWETYRNEMRQLQDATQQNAITYNQVYSVLDQRNREIANDVQYDQAQGTQAVKSAVQGFSGRTSRAISANIEYNRNLQAQQLDEAFNRQQTNFELQRINSALGTKVSLEDGWVAPVDYVGLAMDNIQAGAQAASGGGA